MSTNLEVLEAEVLQLPPVERSHLLEQLIASLDSDPEVEQDLRDDLLAPPSVI